MYPNYFLFICLDHGKRKRDNISALDSKDSPHSIFCKTYLRILSARLSKKEIKERKRNFYTLQCKIRNFLCTCCKDYMRDRTEKEEKKTVLRFHGYTNKFNNTVLLLCMLEIAADKEARLKERHF